MMFVWIVLEFVATVLALAVVGLLALYLFLRWRYGPQMARIFQEIPLFIIPRGQPVEGAEDVRFQSTDGIELCGCYLRTTASQRKGVILFGLEYGSNRWACVPYCEQLLAKGFDIFSFECRGQGDSGKHEGYEPLQWVTNFEVSDTQAALAYLKNRPDADPRGIGFFGISKGGGAGLLAAANDPYVRCFVTDGVFGTFTTMVPYMRKWVAIYNKNYFIQHCLPSWYYEMIGRYAVRRLSRQRLNCRFPDLEKVMKKLAPRPLLMIHGGADTYIKPEMTEALFRRAREPKELWLVDGAKHNQALNVAGEEYHRRVLDFFETRLMAPRTETEPTLRKEAVRDHPIAAVTPCR